MLRLAPRIGHGFASISLSRYVALYGQQDLDRSLDAEVPDTRFGVGIRDPAFPCRRFRPRTLAEMRKWAEDENEHVRRLASEGPRPRLPWSFQLKDPDRRPAPTGPDPRGAEGRPSPYVRKSMASHLNTSARTIPTCSSSASRDGTCDDRHTAWIVRRALRTLIKKGDAARWR